MKSSTARPTSNREEIARLEDIPNVGPAIAADLRQLGIATPDELPGRDPRMRCTTTCATSPANATTRAYSIPSSPPSATWREAEEAVVEVHGGTQA